MKSFIIYVKGHRKSNKQANRCYNLCQRFGYIPELFPGSTAKKMREPFDYPEIEKSRAEDFRKENNRNLYLTKKACFSNHPRLWKMSIELNETIMVLEQDAIPVKKWDDPKFDEVLLCNARSAYRRGIFKHVRPDSHSAFWSKDGIHDLNDGLIYPRENFMKGGYMMPGTASYAVTPLAANKLLAALELYGWEQSDYFINTKLVDIKYAAPDYFKLDLKNNLKLSHGI